MGHFRRVLDSTGETSISKAKIDAAVRSVLTAQKMIKNQCKQGFFSLPEADINANKTVRFSQGVVAQSKVLYKSKKAPLRMKGGKKCIRSSQGGIVQNQKSGLKTMRPSSKVI
jgi:hypothetical protein